MISTVSEPDLFAEELEPYLTRVERTPCIDSEAMQMAAGGGRRNSPRPSLSNVDRWAPGVLANAEHVKPRFWRNPR